MPDDDTVVEAQVPTESSIESQLTPEARDGLNRLIAIASTCPESWKTREDKVSEGAGPRERNFAAEIGGSSSTVCATWADKDNSGSLQTLKIENLNIGMTYVISLKEGVLTRITIGSWGGRSRSDPVQVYDSAEGAYLLPYVSSYLAESTTIAEDPDNAETQRTENEIRLAGCSLREVTAREGDGVVPTVTIATTEGSFGQLGRYQLVQDASGAVLATIDIKTASKKPVEHDVVMAAAAYLPEKSATSHGQ